LDRLFQFTDTGNLRFQLCKARLGCAEFGVGRLEYRVGYWLGARLCGWLRFRGCGFGLLFCVFHLLPFVF
jgi:hypothetical protein